MQRLMSRFSWVLVAVLLNSLVVMPVAAEEASAGASTQVSEMPDPASLRSDWWSFFTVPAEQVPEHLEKLRSFLQARQAVLRESGAGPAVKAYASLLRALDTYGELLAGDASKPDEIAEPKSGYRLTDIYQLAEHIPEIQLSIGLTSREQGRLERLLQEQSVALDILRTEHQAAPPATLERELLALKIMRKRFDVASEQLRIKQAIAGRVAMENRLKSKRSELELAKSRVQFTAADLQEINAELERLEKLKLRARPASDSLDDSLLVDGEVQDRERLQMQRRVLSDLQAADIDAQITLRQMERQLAAYLLDETASVHPLRKSAREMTEWVRERERRVRDWDSYIASEQANVLRRLGEVADADISIPAVLLARRSTLQDGQVALAELHRRLLRGDALSGTALAQIRLREGVWADGWGSAREYTEKNWTAVKEWFSFTLFSIDETPVTPIGILRVMVILFFAYWISRILQGAINGIGERVPGSSKSSLYAITRLLHYLIIVIGVLVGLSSIGVDFTKLALLAGALSVGIGFGLQNIVSNLVSGLIVLFDRSLKIGDFVELESGVVGEVREIKIRSTRITTNDNVDILVPNSEFVNARVTNWTLADEVMRLRVPFGVAYGSDKERVKRAALRAASLVPFTLEQPGYAPQVMMTGFGDSSLDFLLMVWLVPDAVRAPTKVRSAYLWELDTQLAEAEIEIPFPQRDLHIRSTFGVKDDDGMEWFEQMRKAAVPSRSA